MKIKLYKKQIAHIPIIEVVPEQSEGIELPLVVYYHGWQTAKELGLTNARKIAQYNIRVILPDAMFHGERKIPMISTIPSFTFWSSIQHNLSEFDTIIRYYRERKLISNQKIGVAGFSMGGMTTAGLLTQHPEIKAAAILMGTPDYQHFIDTMQQELTKRQIDAPKDLPDLLSWTKAYDLSKQPEVIDGRPIYFWHGTEDEKIPYYHTKAFFDTHKEAAYGNRMSFDTGLGDRHLLRPPTMQETADFFHHYLNL